ncbi:CobW family GTP-binding protein [Halorhodospira halochloris]|uniref:CobW family GTP-binding protein n=1 Tax=Halorhodospira halochloris TaxID=1052 RepID=UPI001EE84155|nr:GTP-binding protein [Halorhodospira halochloris]MCG5548419.1 GTP-binding protein [Halorhodospira halochloris]
MAPPVPTNVITGFLNAGKTTAIRHLLARHRPPAERWAVLINEFGDVSIDAAMLSDQLHDKGQGTTQYGQDTNSGSYSESAPGSGDEQEAVTIAELPGGCLCCTLGIPFRTAITRLLRDSKPARLIIEPTGFGHPAKIIDQLRNFEQQGAIELRATITLVDPRRLKEPKAAQHSAFIDQAQIADILICNKSDLIGNDDRARFEHWSRSLYPPKQIIAETEQGRISANWLDCPTGRTRAALSSPGLYSKGVEIGHKGVTGQHGHYRDNGESLPATSSADHGKQPLSAADSQAQAPDPQPGQPLRLQNDSYYPASCGWIFHRGDIFDRQLLTQALEQLRDCDRVKGVIRTGNDWLQVNTSPDGTDLKATAWRGESRLEVIADDYKLGWDKIEQLLLQAITQTDQS